MEGVTFVIRPLQSATEAGFCADFMAASDPWLTLGIAREAIVSRLTDPTREVWVAAAPDGTITGVLVLFLDGPLHGYIQTLAVPPAGQGQGVGRQLMAFAEERIFRRSPNVFLCVSSFNHAAQAFYARLGYQRVGELSDFLVAGFSEILLRKTRGPLSGYCLGM